MRLYSIVFLAVIPALTSAVSDSWMHPHFPTRIKGPMLSSTPAPDGEPNTEQPSLFWFHSDQNVIEERLHRKPNQNIAKNVILFLGDGMYMDGEDQNLVFDKFPYTGLSKTHCVSLQTADSACSAAAYLGTVKANPGTVGVTANVKRDDCNAMRNVSNHVSSIAHWSQLKKKMTGFVTTARVTHASPAAVYAHSAERDWQSDSDVTSAGLNSTGCRDIAWQLVNGETGKNLNVILGGGRANFLPRDVEKDNGNRLDNIDLISEWQQQKLQHKAEYISNREQLLNLDYNNTEYLLGLFNPNRLSYTLQRDEQKEPSLTEMTEAAINILSKSEDGYFLFIEGATLDMGHKAKAKLALDKSKEFSNAIQAAFDLTSDNDTLIVVTSDHTQTMSRSRYASRRSNILTVASNAILNYANGPENNKDNTAYHQYRGDVGIFAKGPWAHLFTGVTEQHVIPHLMAFASCISDGKNACQLNINKGCAT